MYVGCISRSIDFLAFHTYSPKLKFFATSAILSGMKTFSIFYS